jgi:hypothetical protein
MQQGRKAVVCHPYITRREDTLQDRTYKTKNDLTIKSNKVKGEKSSVEDENLEKYQFSNSG